MFASQIVEAKAPHDVVAVKALFQEYVESLDFELCFQNFDEEMETFPGEYGAPARRCCWRGSTSSQVARLDSDRSPRNPAPAR